MTGLANVGGIDVASGFTTGGSAVMATETGAEYLVVIHCTGRYRCPWRGTGQVTGVARLRGINVACGFPAGNNPVVAACAGTYHVTMIHGTRLYGRPRRGSWLMTGIAGVGGIDVRSTLAGCNSAIVATGTNAGDLRMIHGTGRQW